MWSFHLQEQETSSNVGRQVQQSVKLVAIMIIIDHDDQGSWNYDDHYDQGGGNDDDGEITKAFSEI